MNNIRALTVGSYALDAATYSILLLWLIIQGRTKKTSQRSFGAWILLLAALCMNGVLTMSSEQAQVVHYLYRIHFTLFLGSSVAFWLFGASLRRELIERDLAYTFPALIMMPLIWTILIKEVKRTPFGWDVAPVGPLFFVLLAVIYSYYFITIFWLYKILSVLKTTRSPAIRGARILFFAITTLTVASLLIPIGRVLNLYFVPALANLLFPISIGLMAYSFRLTKH